MVSKPSRRRDPVVVPGDGSRDARTAQLAVLEQVLADERASPWRGLARLAVYRTLAALFRLRPVLPKGMADRLARSAAKRDPRRSIRHNDMTEAAPGDSLRGSGAFVSAGHLAFDAAKPNVLIVSHDASRSGAPIVALNLAEHLSRRYNVTILLLRGGDCTSAFLDHAVRVYSCGQRFTGNLDGLIASICGGTAFTFAILNSSESHPATGGLRQAGVATVALLHEFACMFPATGFDRILQNADALVFSARVTLDDARQRHPVLDAAKAHVIAQGKCRVPTPALADTAREDEPASLRRVLRPDGDARGTFVVLGAGTVSLRKGVDLFIQAATQVLASPDGARARFFWIGGPYDPEGDLAYSVYLADQLRRAGIEDRVTMLPETPDIETAYALADLFLLPSRLDPLPNVGIDAMSAGLPTVCFDRATGLAEQLHVAGAGDACVAKYLDTRDLADKVLAFAGSPQLCAEVASRLRAHAETAFDFAAYARRIEALGLSAAERVRAGRTQSTS